jgi:hypothetical protein
VDVWGVRVVRLASSSSVVGAERVWRGGRAGRWRRILGRLPSGGEFGFEPSEARLEMGKDAATDRLKLRREGRQLFGGDRRHAGDVADFRATGKAKFQNPSNPSGERLPENRSAVRTPGSAPSGIRTPRGSDADGSGTRSTVASPPPTATPSSGRASIPSPRRWRRAPRSRTGPRRESGPAPGPCSPRGG